MRAFSSMISQSLAMRSAEPHKQRAGFSGVRHSRRRGLACSQSSRSQRRLTFWFWALSLVV
jgi:hypothetical protein